MASSNDTKGSLSRGSFIVLEGLDRSGKTTQVRLLEQLFIQEGRPVKLMRFPDRSTVIGQMIDNYLKSNVEMEDHVIHLLFSANRWEAVNQITSLLESGITIISDRYYHSGIVYSAAKQNPTLSLAWARAPDEGLPRPDLVLFLDLRPEEVERRGGFGEEVYEKAEMQRRVRELFLSLGKGVNNDHNRVTAFQDKEQKGEVTVVDAEGSVGDVTEKIWNIVKKTLRRVDVENI